MSLFVYNLFERKHILYMPISTVAYGLQGNRERERGLTRVRSMQDYYYHYCYFYYYYYYFLEEFILKIIVSLSGPNFIFPSILRVNSTIIIVPHISHIYGALFIREL